MKKYIKTIILILVSLFVSALVLLFFSPKPKLIEDISFSKTVYDNQHRLLRMTLSKDDKFRVFSPISQILPQLIQATLLQEDQYFYQHWGVNPYSLLKAVWQTYVLKSRRVGASTITMQLARIRYGLHSKKISGKLWQIIRALQIERHYSKDQILEAYLNLAPYGGNIEGVEAASLIYFNIPTHQLTLPQALTLSIIPQNPGKRTPNNIHLKDIRNHLYARWLKNNPKDSDKSMLFELPLVMQTTKNLPFKAPHFTNKILQDPFLRELNIDTSLDSGLQKILEKTTRRYIARKNHLGVYNASVLLIDTRDMGIKALLGSVDFMNKTIGGQINGVDNKRSPGSTLKPFIYGLALDQGLIHPNTVLKDVPHSFGAYNPENFDYDFMGPIKAKDALVLSRNIPAIYLSSLLSKPNLYQFLEKGHVAHMKSESFYGLSINLGGAELSMTELVGLYAMLVNDGVWYPVSFLKGQGKNQGERLLSSEASYLVLDMLKNTPLHDIHYTDFNLPVSWKTGTSSGYRDAWTIGSFGPYVLAVWIGNFDNKSNPAFIGKDIAAPLFFELIEGIKQERSPLAPVYSDPYHMNLKQINVCKASGMLPTRYCTDTEKSWFIPGKSPIKTDTIYREVAINSQSGLRTCHINENTRFEVFEFWPSDLLKIFKRAGIQRHIPPFFEEDCRLSGSTGISPQITSPQTGLSYVMRANNTHTNKIPLSAVTDAGIEFVYWFVNETFIAKVKADHEYLWLPKPGHYVIRVVDDHGLSDARDITVQMAS